MGAWHLVRRTEDGGADAAAIAAARAQFERAGHTKFTPLDHAGHAGFHAAPVNGGPTGFLAQGDDWIAVAGSLTYKGRMGTAALEKLLTDFAFPWTDWNALGGQFALAVCKGGTLYALTDFFGAFQLFHDPACDVVSTGFLATAQAQQRLEWDVQAVFETAFAFFALGDATPFRQIRRLGPDAQLELDGKPRRQPVDKPLPHVPAIMPMAERLMAQGSALQNAADPWIATFGDAIDCPFSAGFDSRLVLALLRDGGAAPHAYIYGSPGDADVEIPQAIADAEGFALEVFDKQAFRTLDPDAFPAEVERAFHETDGIVTDGGLFDNGGNRAARLKRQRGGRATASGGCGEVFRNFFYLPDRCYSPRDVAHAFYAYFDPADMAPAYRAGDYIDSVAHKAAASLGLDDPDEKLPRGMIEQLYPRMRCRSFFGREISIVGRQGAYFMPFYERGVVEHALRLPMDLKAYGRFEARLIDMLDPRLARHTSSYGHSFAVPPSRAHRVAEWSTLLRPMALRRRSYALRRKLRAGATDPHGGLLGAEYLGRAIDLDFPAMRRFFDIENIADDGVYRRLAGLEYLAQSLGSRIAA